MKITIEWSEIKTTQTGKEYKKVAFKDAAGALIEASVWADAPFYAQIAPGSEIEAEVRKSSDGKYTNLVMANQGPTRGAGMTAMKTAQIEKAMDKKADQIAKAQDRSAWMWSKTNASTLLSGDASRLHGKNSDEIATMVITLATKIYNGEPFEPFTTPKLEEDHPYGGQEVDMSDMKF